MSERLPSKKLLSDEQMLADAHRRAAEIRKTPDDRYRKVGTTQHINNCTFCGQRAELWQRHERADEWSSAVMCSNFGEDADPTGDPCPLHLPPEVFHFPTKRQAIAYWNQRTTPPGTFPVHADPTGKTREPPHCPTCNCGSGNGDESPP